VGTGAYLKMRRCPRRRFDSAMGAFKAVTRESYCTAEVEEALPSST